MANVVLGEKRIGDTRIRSSGGTATLEETYQFLVRSDNKNNSRFTMLLTPGLPVVGVTISSYGLTVCKSKNISRRADNPLLWDATCEFSSEVDESQSSQDPASDPTEWVPVYETKFERLQEVVSKDLSGDPIANSAGQAFNNGLTVSRFIPVWEFFQFEPISVNDNDIIGRNETVNSSLFKNCPAKTLLLTVLSSVVGYYYGQRRRLTQYSLKYNAKKWTQKRLDVGTVYLSGGDLLPYTDEQGNLIEGGLNGSGAKVAAGDPPSVLEFDMFASDSFSFLRT